MEQKPLSDQDLMEIKQYFMLYDGSSIEWQLVDLLFKEIKRLKENDK